MCELLAMSANVPTDIVFSFTGLIQRGGTTGPHTDGWGIAFYENKGLRSFKDTCKSSESTIAKFISSYPIKSKTVIAHIRQANRGGLSLENTHPFTKELWGYNWTFAHNGELHDYKKALELQSIEPIGETDSELAFCWIIEKIIDKFGQRFDHKSNIEELFSYIGDISKKIASLGIFNMILSDGEYLMAFCGNNLCTIQRVAPFTTAQLADMDLTVDFTKETTINDKVIIIATRPLTTNEKWDEFTPSMWKLFKYGERLL